MILQQMMSALCAGILAVTTVITPGTSNPQTTEAMIDPAKKGSIKIVKLEDNDGIVVDGTYVDKQDNIDRVRVGGVWYSACKIADISSLVYEHEKNAEAGTYFTNVNADFLKLLNASDQNASVIGNDRNGTALAGEKGFSTTKMVQLMDTVVGSIGEMGLDCWVRDHSPKELQAKTDDNGEVLFNNLSLGLYAVAETDPTQAYTIENGEHVPYKAIDQVASPMLISVPSTNLTEVDGQPAGSVWQYDITAYPKNSTVTVDKSILSDKINDKQKETAKNAGDVKDAHNRLIATNDYKIGDIIRQTIHTDVPVTLQGLTKEDGSKEYQNRFLNQEYQIVDYMSKGLTFIDIDDVYLGPKSVSIGKESDAIDQVNGYEKLVRDADYTVASTAYMPESKQDTETATMSKRTPSDLDLKDLCVIDTTGTSEHALNGFTVTLTDKGRKKLDTCKVESRIITTFRARLNKDAVIGTDSTTDEWNAKNTGNTNTPMLFYKHTNAYEHHVRGPQRKIFTYSLELTKLADQSAAISPNKIFDPSAVRFSILETAPSRQHTAENLKLINEKAGIYHVYDSDHDDEKKIVTEIAPNQNGKLLVKGLDSEKYTLTEVMTSDGYQLLKSDFDVELQNDSPEKTNLTGAIKAAVLSADGSRVAIKNDLASGHIKINVVNFKGIRLRTGGEGTRSFTIVSIALLCLATVMAVCYKKRLLSHQK